MLGKAHFYHEAIKRAVSVFGTMFNEIDIQRDNADGTTSQNIRVPLSYGPKQKFIARLDQAADLMDNTNSRVAMTLPRLAFDITGIGYDAERKLGKLKQYKLQDASDNTVLKTQFAPVPYNIQFGLYCMAKNTEDALQIVEQILPFFTPDFTVTMTTVPGTAEKRDVPIVLQDVSYDDQYEGDFQSRRVIIWTLNFEMKTYLYGSISKSEIIRDVRARTYMSDTGKVDTTSGRQSEISVIPNPTSASPETSPLNITETINFFDGNNTDYLTDRTTIGAIGSQSPEDQFSIPTGGGESQDDDGNSGGQSITTYQITVDSKSGYGETGNAYYYNGVQQQTFSLVRGTTYRFSQSNASNSGHPLKLSTTSDGTHNSGSEYTTGVTYVGTPGSSGSYTQIIVDNNTPSTLYYYCTNHSGMGGTINIS